MTQRGVTVNMRGSIRKQGKDSWQIRFYVDKKQTSLTFRGKKSDAQRYLTNIQAQIDAGTFVEPSKLTFGDLLEQWLNHRIQHSVRPNTYRSYKQIVETHIMSSLGKIPLSKLRPLHVEKLIGEKMAPGGRGEGNSNPLSPRTVSYILTITRMALGHGVKLGLVAKNVAESVEPPRQKKAEIVTWDARQTQAFLEHVSADRLYPLFLTAILVGLRRGEIAGLRWSDVDLQDHRASIRQTLISVGGKPVYSKPKTSNANRTVALSPVLIEELKRCYSMQQAERAICGSGYSDNGLVFCQMDGSPYHPDNLSSLFRRAVKEAGLPTIRFHDLRHIHATLLLAQGTNIRLISERLGHSSVQFTMQTYAHSLPGQQEEAALRLDEQLFGKAQAPANTAKIIRISRTQGGNKARLLK